MSRLGLGCFGELVWDSGFGVDREGRRKLLLGIESRLPDLSALYSLSLNLGGRSPYLLFVARSS